MPNFTVELRALVEDGEDIGLNDYPIFRADYRDILNKKITDHYWFYEIGHETHFMFARQMRTKMNEIMPYYNQLYETELIKFDPFMTMQVTTENSSENKMDSEAKADSRSSTEAVSKSATRVVNSQFPQTRLSGDQDYATNAADTNSAGESDNASTGDSREESKVAGESSGRSSQVGYTGNRSNLLTDFRSTILNIDMMIIDELSELFMGVWNNSDEYSGFSGSSVWPYTGAQHHTIYLP